MVRDAMAKHRTGCQPAITREVTAFVEDYVDLTRRENPALKVLPVKPRPLSKSRFKLAVECPTKVFYSLDKRYVNTQDEDEFLHALADGGFQVGELAKRMYLAEDPGAVEVTAREQGEQVQQTAELLTRPNATVFEGTVRHQDCLARVDVLRKRGDVVELIEVKSKSFKPGRDSFRGARGGILTDWLAYLQDVTFQTWVFRQAYPQLEVRPFLLMVDPTKTCSVDGLGTAIRVERDADNRAIVTVDPAFDLNAVQPALLTAYDVAEYVDEILATPLDTPQGAFEFAEYAERMAAAIMAGRKIEPTVGAHCRKCEFYCEPGDRRDDLRSGWAECMEARFPGRGGVARSDTVFALYDDRRKKAIESLGHGKLLLTELDEDDVGSDESDQVITLSHRHRLQIREARAEEAATLLRSETLRNAFAEWRYPLHFIDFETARPTLPFTAGRRPNQQLLFQFSHHVMDEHGRVEHRTECLEARPGVVPNAAVVRALRDALSGDEGTVLHWWDHERNVLRDVREELESGAEPDREQLVRFIGTLLGTTEQPGRLVDMGRPLVAKTVFIAGTDGRSSIKKVLQALLAQSAYLREKYSQPVYGTTDLPSRNFRDWTWWQQKDGHVVDPYLLLGQLLEDPELDRLAREEEEEEATAFVANGGAAMVAYGQLQRRDLVPAERARLERQLKRYCELDTLAMVMVYEALREWVA